MAQSPPKAPEPPKGASEEMQTEWLQLVQQMQDMHTKMDAIRKWAAENSCKQDKGKDNKESMDTSTSALPPTGAGAAGSQALATAPAHKQRKTNDSTSQPGSGGGQPLSQEQLKAAHAEAVAKQDDANGNFKRISEEEQNQAKALAEQMLKDAKAELLAQAEQADKDDDSNL